MFGLINFFLNPLFSRSVNTNISILAPHTNRPSVRGPLACLQSTQKEKFVSSADCTQASGPWDIMYGKTGLTGANENTVPEFFKCVNNHGI